MHSDQILSEVRGQLALIRISLDYLAGILKDIPYPPSPLGWDGLEKVSKPTEVSRSELINYCKRIEYVYKTSPSVFIPYNQTLALVEDIVSTHGLHRLIQYVQHLEDRHLNGGWAGFYRPERMREHWLQWKAQYQPNPAQ